MEIPDEIITPKFGYQLIVELVEAGSLPETSKSKYTRIIKQHFFFPCKFGDFLKRNLDFLGKRSKS